MLIAMSGMVRPRWDWAMVDSYIHFKDGRCVSDRDNLTSALKTCHDAIEQSGIIVNDENLICLPGRYRDYDKESPNAVLRIFEIEKDSW